MMLEEENKANDPLPIDLTVSVTAPDHIMYNGNIYKLCDNESTQNSSEDQNLPSNIIEVVEKHRKGLPVDVAQRSSDKCIDSSNEESKNLILKSSDEQNSNEKAKNSIVASKSKDKSIVLNVSNTQPKVVISYYQVFLENLDDALSVYWHLFLFLIITCTISWILITFHADINKKYIKQVEDLEYEISKCQSQYVADKCDERIHLNLWVEHCTSLKDCLRKPKDIEKLPLIGEIIGDIFNKIFATMNFSTMFCLAMIMFFFPL